MNILYKLETSYHLDDGGDFVIIAMTKSYALIKKVSENKTFLHPYVVCFMLTFDNGVFSWANGHYFKTRKEAFECFFDRINSEI